MAPHRTRCASQATGEYSRDDRVRAEPQGVFRDTYFVLEEGPYKRHLACVGDIASWSAYRMQIVTEVHAAP